MTQNPTTRTIAVTGGAGYIGALVCRELRDAGFAVRALDALLHGQDTVAEELAGAGVELHRGDVRDADARRRALSGAHGVVHLAAIVGDPACAEDPETAHAVNIDGARGVVEDAVALGVERFVFASTCSNYGRMADPTTPIDEDAPLAPVSLYAEQKVAIERHLQTLSPDVLGWTGLRFATIYGIAPRMRFDLTVNEFTRDLAAGRALEVFGEQFWRPYVHVADAAHAVRMVLESPADRVCGTTFNVGRTADNHRKLDLVGLIRRQVDTGSVAYVSRSEDPRDYRVDFSRVRDVLGFVPRNAVPDGIREIAAAIAAGTYPDPWHRRHRNSG